MTRLWLGASVALLAVLPQALDAQQRRAEPSRPKERSGQLWTSVNRQRIGVALEADGDEETDRIGAKVASVTPDGPADDAGIRAGDIITRFGNTRLGGDEPTRKLVELAQELEPGDTVRVEYQRNGSRRNATLVAEDLGGSNFAMTIPRMHIEQMMPALEGMRDNFSMFVGGWPGLRLQELNEGLGEYFGTSEGLLVLEAPSDSTLPLRPGDVITSIDGRTPQSVGHAMRILGSYSEGESVKFEVMRKQQRQTLEWKVSERRAGSRLYRFEGPHREPMVRPGVRVAPSRAPRERA